MELTLSRAGRAVDNYWFRRHEVAYLAARPWVRGATVLDLAGEGYGADILARVAREVIVDRDLPDHGIDAVVSLQNLPDVAECARVLRPAGTLIVSTPTRPGGARELTELVEPHFRIDRLYGVRHRRRLRRLDLVAAQAASPPATWHPTLRREIARVTHRDFTFTEDDVDTSLDLFAIAIAQ
ncbi:class I SAM-dependent methyltransferase [Cryptosporangium sp. NPDC048952]|uniref:class I SAM-dependent methyltransferase n=1 Tax=Cryptosporangium sp. NPDC048952 TaxID=3363961 RepID=UPI00371D4EEC